MFAIASDDVEQVKLALESGDAGPNDAVGPQSALEFALTNDQLLHKMEIVKTLLAYGADPSVVNKVERERAAARREGEGSVPVPLASGSVQASEALPVSPVVPSMMEGIDPATRLVELFFCFCF